MLLAQKAYVEGALALNLFCAHLIDEHRIATDPAQHHRLHLLLEILTPVAKSWPSQWCLAANDLAIQVHGGYGYTREYKVEQFYRDNRLNPIHEGTHGIQGLDLLGRKVTMENGAALEILGERIAGTVSIARGDANLAGYADALERAWQRILATTRTVWTAGDVHRTLANSSVYLEAFGHVVVAWIWLEQALATRGGDDDFYRGKRMAARYFFGWELPKVDAQLDLLDRLDTTTMEMADAWF
jgi:alkylation response protein AidB-like acyl-CoA dehydrogenase